MLLLTSYEKEDKKLVRPSKIRRLRSVQKTYFNFYSFNNVFLSVRTRMKALSPYIGQFFKQIFDPTEKFKPS
jgi:hypothetical protein